MFVTPNIVVLDSGRRSESLSFVLCKYVFNERECQHQCCDADGDDCRCDNPIERIFDWCVLLFHCCVFLCDVEDFTQTIVVFHLDSFFPQ